MERGAQRPIRCVLIRVGPETYVASFCTKYFGFIPKAYEIHLHVEEGASEFRIRGAADLGFLLGGVHHFDGQAKPSAVQCWFKSTKDNGEFRLIREQ